MEQLPRGCSHGATSRSYGLLEFRLNNLSDPEVVITRRYLATLSTLEMAVPAASNNLDTNQASMWTRNDDELTDRIRLFDEWRRRFCGFLGVTAGPALKSGSSAALVV